MTKKLEELFDLDTQADPTAPPPPVHEEINSLDDSIKQYKK